LERVGQLYNASAQAQQVQLQQQQQRAAAEQQQLKAWAAEQDAIFQREVAVKESPARMQEITQNVVELAQEYGVSKEELAHVWQTQPVLRSAAFQRMLVDAAKYRMAQKQIANKAAPPPVPPVQRPGVSAPRSGDDGVAKALKAFSNDPSPKAAANLLMAKRAASRR
jgi:hypothetical protein